VTSLSLCLDNSEIWSQTLGCLLFYEGFTTFILEPKKILKINRNKGTVCSAPKIVDTVPTHDNLNKVCKLV
jgi:hypothetical protein